MITGGASGLGEATAERLARQGAKVAILDVQTERAQTVAERIGGIAVHCDVTSAESAQEAIAIAREKHGVARVLVNCAGAGSGKRVVGKSGPMPLEDFTKIINLNLVGTFNMTRLAAADMIASDPIGEERGVILFTSSVAAFEGQIGQAAYAASKGGVASMTIQLAREFAQFGVRVMTIAPGIFLTPLLYTASPEVQESLANGIPFPRRLGQPDEFADLVSHIVGNRYLNGEIIRIDGATRMAPR
ncbi:SDR family NAD(P)-dependent oxidoreductase [Neopusillimonas aromaticivorans]|uniref:SDR family NAD(P)-dependent oxidoreductase n=1 Tax=Neopusillimonas aromaticivorans TaxID=2979868 RepID=UPI0025925353|nr:SDR family NAD(P)-dependent oxidoreductase [Neopusillimonas aromaticivorans]WJJ92921.1 SDR family NAD(P)-dependent oxidoreductase [Neopusillimonas aromaticivorans]